MAEAATAAKPAAPLNDKARAKLAATLRARAEARIDIEIEHAAVFAKIDGMDAELKKALASQLGHSVKEVFLQKGEVNASPRKAKEFKGDLPELQDAVWTAMPVSERRKLVKLGLFKLVPTWSRADNGRVTTKLFTHAPQGVAT